MQSRLFPTIGDGFLADVKGENYELRLFSEVYALGYRAKVYDMKTKREVWRDDADSHEDGKKKAEEFAAEYLKRVHKAKLPAVDWQINAQSKQEVTC